MTLTDYTGWIQSAIGDGYVLERTIGRGGAATVYLAQDLISERDVAIKVLHPELSATLMAERFRREIRLLGRLDHPNILPLLDSGESGGIFYFVMPLAKGESLRVRPQPGRTSFASRHPCDHERCGRSHRPCPRTRHRPP